ncbi:MAG: NAD(P)-binding domain-containing protein [Syntrophales bacterium]
MKIAIIGLGKMGMNMARRLLKSGHEVVEQAI